MRRFPRKCCRILASDTNRLLVEEGKKRRGARPWPRPCFLFRRSRSLGNVLSPEGGDDLAALGNTVDL